MRILRKAIHTSNATKRLQLTVPGIITQFETDLIQSNIWMAVCGTRQSAEPLERQMSVTNGRFLAVYKQG